jgi:hypothetical protein
MIITVAFVALACLALYRRPDWVAGGLLVALLFSTALGWSQPAARLPGMLGGMDALVSIGMLALWTHYRSQRARIVGTVALLKCAWAFVMSSNGIDWLAYAIVLNAAFVFQVLVAGGMTDGFIAWLDYIDPRTARQRNSRRQNLG